MCYCTTKNLYNIYCWLQVFAIEFVGIAIEFVPFAIEFVPFAIELVGFAVELVGFAIEFVAFALQFVIIKQKGSKKQTRSLRDELFMPWRVTLATLESNWSW